MKLNLASGSNYRPGWTNLDIIAWPGYRAPDAYWDARKDRIPCDDYASSHIYMGYTLLHIEPRYRPFLLSEVHRVLAPTGLLTVCEVDMNIVMLRWLEDPGNVNLSEHIWGELGSEHGAEYAQYDTHHHGFTEKTLRLLLEEHGFVVLNRIHVHHPDVFAELTLACQKA